MPLKPENAALAERVRNWGRWGPDDERGTLNLIDDAARARGLAAIKSGEVIPMAVLLDEIASPQEPGGAPGRINPRLDTFSVNATFTGNTDDACFNDENVRLSTSAGTHVDSLAHVTYGEKMYNGYPADLVTTEGGVSRCGAESIGPIVSRGLLLDFPALRGVDRLDPGTAITAEDLDELIEEFGISPEPGDVICIRTGQMQLLAAGDVEAYNHDSAGLCSAAIEWFSRNDAAAVFTDTYIFEVWPPEDWEQLMCVHMIHLRDMGLMQGQNFDFEALAERCAVDGRYEFLFSGCPEPLRGAASAPIAPLAFR